MGIYSVLIIGAGKIGAFFDTPQSDAVLTHAHAFSANPGFRLAGFVDADLQQAERAANLWGGEAFHSLDDAFSGQQIDVVVIAVPDELHYRFLLEVADHNPKLVFAEKPLARSVVEAETIVQLYCDRGISLAVNYSRRFVPDFATLQNKISTGKFGRYLTGTGYYGKGTLHNGSHMIDLLRFMLGEVSGVRCLESVCDWRDDDPTCTAILDISGGGHFIMQAMDCRCFTLFEMELFFENTRIRMVDSGFGVEILTVADSEVFAGYRVLTPSDRYTTGLGASLAYAVADIYGHLTKGTPLACTGADGLRALAVCTDIAGISS